MNNLEDWRRIHEEGWYRIPAKRAPECAPHFEYIAFYFSKAFGEDKWAIHYYAPILGHELLTRRDLIPSEPEHKRAADWYYELQVGPLQHKLPPIVVSHHWQRITFGWMRSAKRDTNFSGPHKWAADRYISCFL